MAISHFLITDRAKDDEREYFNQTIVKTNMTWEEMTQNNHNGWEEHFLRWQFGDIEKSDSSGDIWSDNRIVCIYDTEAVPEEEVDILKKSHPLYDLDKIVRDQMEKRNHFLITDQNRDGVHEYYDPVLVSTVMSEEEMDNNHNGWERYFLSWQFGGVQEEDDNGDIWSDHRIVCIYDLKAVPEEDVPVLDKYLSTFDLDQIIKDEIEESEA